MSQYNFEAIAEELVQIFDKKLEAHQKAVIKQISILFDFLGDRLPYEQRKQLEQIISDHLSDGNKSQSALFISTTNKIIRSIREIIHD